MKLSASTVPVSLASVTAFFAVFAYSTEPAAAQSVTVVTSPPVADLGRIVSASDETAFRISPADGNVTRIGGGAVRVTSGPARASVQFTCSASGNSATTLCAAATAQVTITSTSGQGRAKQLTNLQVQSGTATASAITGLGTSSVSFTVSGLARNQTRNVWLGGDFSILAGGGGSATAPFIVNVVAGNSTSGHATANVFRPIAVIQSSNLNFGSIIKPATGSGVVTLTADGARTVTGGGSFPNPAPASASYQVTGEGGQTFSILMPSTFAMTSSAGGSLTVTLSSNAVASPTLSSTLGSPGVYNFKVGGSFPITSTTATGTYQGSYAVTVQYN